MCYGEIKLASCRFRVLPPSSDNCSWHVFTFAKKKKKDCMLIHIHVHNQTPECLLVHLNLFPLKQKPPALPLIPPTLSISAILNFPLLWSPCRLRSFSAQLSLTPLSLSLSQVLVAFISFSETMLLVYLSYKVSHSGPSSATLRPSVISAAMMSMCVCVWRGMGVDRCDVFEDVCLFCTPLHSHKQIVI